MTGIWEGFRSLAQRVRSEFGSGTEWVEPGNWITHAVITGQLDSVSFSHAPRRYDLAPDNVLIATSAPRPAATGEENPAPETEAERIARAG
jgi:hypothetical protein